MLKVNNHGEGVKNIQEIDLSPAVRYSMDIKKALKRILIGFVFIIFIVLSLISWGKYKNEEGLCFSQNRCVLMDIEMALLSYIDDTGQISPNLSYLNNENYWNSANKINDWRDPIRLLVPEQGLIYFLPWNRHDVFYNDRTKIEKNCSYIYNPNVDIKNVPDDFIIVAEPFPSYGYRYVLFLKPIITRNTLKNALEQIPEKEFQEIAKKYKWQLPYTTRNAELKKINTKRPPRGLTCHSSRGSSIIEGSDPLE